MRMFLRQLLDLTLVQLTNWRWAWRGQVITSTVFPALSTATLGVFAGTGSDALIYVVTGNIVLSLLFGTVGRVSGNFAYMRVNGMLDYFATLPISRAALILATVLAFLLLSIPSAIVTLLIGAAILQLPLNINPLIIVVLPLITMALAGLGALIGLLGKTPDDVGNMSTLITFALLGVGPVIIPADRLPPLLQAISVFSPATYAASALRQVVMSVPDRIPLAVDIAVLFCVMIGLLWIVGQKIDWRGR
ncbi:MAG: ABC transporter permease [Anaerolineae bacterium]|nr:ABC transporter permease [Anaerolineae bacterium]